MVPTAGLEVLRGVPARELAELRAAARAVELQLLPFEVRVADTQQQVLLDTHHRGDVHGTGIAAGINDRGCELVDIDQRLVGHGRKSVPGLTVGAVLVEGREVDPVARAELCGHGDRRGALDDVVGHVRAAQYVD